MSAPELLRLASDPFGNYVVQIALRHAPPPSRALLLAALLPRFDRLAREKCGSNVAEALAELASDEQKRGLWAALGADGAASLRTHAYGSFAMQALDGRRRTAAAA